MLFIFTLSLHLLQGIYLFFFSLWPGNKAAVDGKRLGCSTETMMLCKHLELGYGWTWW